jgi:phage terminase large subunit-like protein
VRLIRDLFKRFKEGDPSVVVTLGTIYDNRANLAPSFYTHIVSKYEGTRTGQQELLGLLLEQAEGALWTREMIEHTRRSQSDVPELTRVVVAIDPAVSSEEDSNETGIITGGIGVDGHGYILTDHSGRYTPHGWATRAIEQYDLRAGDRIVGEVNNGGDLIESTLRTIRPNISYRKLHASRGKQTRAEPVVSFFEQNKCHLVGSFPDLEDQLCNWEPGKGEDSPDRLDAMVWCITELMVDVKPGWGDYYPAKKGVEERAQ